MPLDSHQYLVKQGWGGKGTALRHGSLVRPIAIPQKRTLAGVGKDRDEAFPFWDHLFTVSAKTIQIKVHRDSDEESSCGEQNDSAQTAIAILARTKTGILSNKRPITGTPASTSGTSTPSTSDSSSTSQASNISLLSLAKREAAKRSLYIRFYRGPVLGPDIPSILESQPLNVAGPSSGVGGPSATKAEIEAKESGKKKGKEKGCSSKERVEGEAVEKETAKEKSTKSGKDKNKKRKHEDSSRPVKSNEASPDEDLRSRKKKRKDIHESSSGSPANSSTDSATPTDSPTSDPTHKSTSDSIEIEIPPVQPDTISDPKTIKAARKAEKWKRKEEKELRRVEREARRQRRRERKASKEKSG